MNNAAIGMLRSPSSPWPRPDMSQFNLKILFLPFGSTMDGKPSCERAAWERRILSLLINLRIVLQAASASGEILPSLAEGTACRCGTASVDGEFPVLSTNPR
jgi:hypothetical protein